METLQSNKSFTVPAFIGLVLQKQMHISKEIEADRGKHRKNILCYVWK